MSYGNHKHSATRHCSLFFVHIILLCWNRHLLPYSRVSLLWQIPGQRMSAMGDVCASYQSFCPSWQGKHGTGGQVAAWCLYFIFLSFLFYPSELPVTVCWSSETVLHCLATFQANSYFVDFSPLGISLWLCTCDFPPLCISLAVYLWEHVYVPMCFVSFFLLTPTLNSLQKYDGYCTKCLR